MVNYKDVENIIELLDSRMSEGVNRINLHVEDTVNEGETIEVYHHGRCDVGSPWAKGTVGNFEAGDNEDESCGRIAGMNDGSVCY